MVVLAQLTDAIWFAPWPAVGNIQYDTTDCVLQFAGYVKFARWAKTELESFLEKCVAGWNKVPVLRIIPDVADRILAPMMAQIPVKQIMWFEPLAHRGE